MITGKSRESISRSKALVESHLVAHQSSSYIVEPSAPVAPASSASGPTGRVMG